MSATSLISHLVEELLVGRNGAYAGESLKLLEETGRIPSGTDLKSLRSVSSWEMLYGSTTGPFPGVGGAAMTLFRMTILHSDTAMLLFAGTASGDRLYGAAPFDAAVLAAPAVEHFVRYIPDGSAR